ncbi:MAG: ATP-binding protein [Thermoguttaceae bacterium]|nr:ATP-binding protein [Thermoguttaceae bacterium]
MSIENNASSVWKLKENLPSVSGSGEGCIDAVVAELAARGWDDGDQYAMRLALSEALENAVEHGNRRDSSKQIHLSVEIDDARALASVRDEGPGFAFAETPDPTLEENIGKMTGRGLFLIRSFMTNVWHNEVGNVIYLEKKPGSNQEEAKEEVAS